jgi:dephospho-CoA kinase
MFIVGLTGGIGSGKSTVARHFMNLGVPCIDADLTAREVVQPGEPALAAIQEHFSSVVLLADGTLNRGKLREIIFANPAARKWLNDLLHPLIRHRMLQQCEQTNGPYCILMVPLLFENNLQSFVHRTLVIDVDEKTQIRRTRQRDNTTDEQVKSIMGVQFSREQRRILADDLLINSDDFTPEQRQIEVNKLHKTYLQLATQKDNHNGMV